jgi:predicted small secreted protein
MLKRISVLMLALAAITLTACNTVQGVGKDVQKAGEKLEDAAKKK